MSQLPFDYSDEQIDFEALPTEIRAQVLAAQGMQAPAMDDVLQAALRGNQLAGEMPTMSRITNKQRQAISKRALAGYEPTPEEQAMQAADMPRLEANSETLAAGGAELTGIPSIMRGADNVSRGWNESDPWRMAGGAGQVALGAVPGLTVARAPAAAMLAGTMPRAAATGAAASVPLGVSDAHAASGAGIAKAFDGDPEVQRIRQEIAAKEADRTRIATQPVRGMSAASADKARATASAQIDGDIARLNEQLGKVQQRVESEYRSNAPFRERYPGAAEALFAGGLGIAGGMPFADTMKRRVADFAFNRPAPTMAAEAGHFGKSAAAGSLAVFEGSGLPEQIDALSFSPGHPTREKARAELTSPDYYASRIPAAVLSGATGTLLGTEAAKLITPGARQSAGAKQSASPPAPAPAPQSYKSYSQLPPDVRQNVRDAYAADRSLRGGNLPPKDGAQAIRESLEKAGVVAPITSKRVAETNSAWSSAEQKAGRPLTRQEAGSVWTGKTLAVPFAAAGGAAAGAHHINEQRRDPKTGRLVKGWQGDED